MKVEISVPEVVSIFKEIQGQPERIFEMIRVEIREEEEWISLRTTNIIERLYKEFKRRTKPMEIVAGENGCNNLLAFICLKMELHWKSNPIGKVRKSLPFFKKLLESNFTQKT